MLAQLSENKELKPVFDELFQSYGSEIYLKPIKNYINTGEFVDFYTLVEIAAQRNETAIGYRKIELKGSSKDNFGVVINPKKQEEVLFSENDFLIVVSEN